MDTPAATAAAVAADAPVGEDELEYELYIMDMVGEWMLPLAAAAAAAAALSDSLKVR